MLIKITKEHIEKGRPGECLACPIKLAFLDLEINVKVDTLFLIYENRKYDLPKIAVHFINDFDNHRTVEPMEFEITL